MKKPQKHAEIIKAWADGETVEYLNCNTGRWVEVSSVSFRWDIDDQYRIKPKPEYPKTLMDYDTMMNVWERYHAVGDGLLSIANAAIRHAIDSGQVIIAPKGE